MDVGLLHGPDHEVRPRPLGVRGHICTQFATTAAVGGTTENDRVNVKVR